MTTYHKRPVSGYFFGFIFSILALTAAAQTTSWRGTTSAAWATAANWTNGVPTATTDAVLGDASFTGSFNPSITATSVCNSLTVGGGSRTITLTVNALVTVSTNVSIATLGTINHTANSISVRGNWSNTGTYNPTVNTATVVFSGTTQTINNTTSFRRVTVNSGSTTSLAANITVSNAFVVSGTFDPVTATNLVTLTGSTFTVNAAARIRVHAATFAGNYSVNPTTLNATSIVEYASAAISQTIATLGYGTLTISGGSLKTLAANTTLLSTSNAAGRVNLNAGTLDLGTFTLNRNAAGGGIFTVSNGATLIIGGTNTFPANYNTNTLGATSTVIYNGANQTVTARTYGHLILTGSTGAVVKTMPATAMTIAGDFTSTVGTATSVTYTAGAAITINGNVAIGASTTFNGGTATHILAGNFANAGVFNGNTSTLRFNGAAKVLSGAGTQNLNNLTVAGAGVTCSSANLTLTGNLATTGTGTFTHNAGNTITLAGTAKTITGTGNNLSNVVVSGTVTTTVSFPIGGNINVSGSFSATAGTITLSGAAPVITNTGTLSFFALSLTNAVSTSSNINVRSNISGAGKLTSTATVTFIGTSTVSGTHDLFNVTVNGTRLQLGANATLNVSGALTITAGTFNTTTTTPNTFVYNGSGSQNVTAATYNNLTLANGGTKTALGATTTGGTFTINSGVTYNASTFSHVVSGNWINNGTYTSTGAVTLNGALNVSITGATTFNTLTMNKSTAATTVTLNNNVSVTTLTATQGRMLTGANTLTITGTRTGNAVVLGTITRTHAFAANTAYAFESSFNTINFTSITGGSVTSVTVTVTSAPVPDFPSSNSINRQYNISVTKTGVYVATLRLHYDDTELNGNVEANMNLWKFLAGTWTAAGKQSNDVANNWVQQTAQADVTGRWTLFDGSSTQVWKGTTSSVWTAASNWKSGVAPTAVDNVQIGSESFTNQPSITTAAAAKSITFGSVQSVVLTVGGGAGSLTLTGNLAGDWTADRTHTISIGTRSLTVGGDVTLSNGTAARSIQVNASTGTISIAGSLNQPGAGNLVFSGAGNLNIGTDYNYTGGTFTPSTGTVTYNGTIDQAIAGVTYNNLNITKASGNAALSGNSTVNGSLAVSGASVVNLNASLDVIGSLTINAGATLNANSTTLRVGGNWTRTGTFNAVSGAVTLNGTGSQTISGTTFNDLIINKSSGVATSTGDHIITGDLSLSSGTLDLATFLANRSTAGGTLTVSAGTTLRVGGASNFPANFDTRTLSNTSTVHYNGSVAQSVLATTYGNLIMSNGGALAKALTGDTQVNGDLTINSGATLDGSTFQLSLGGNLINSGTFTPSTSSVELLGNGKLITGPVVFNNVDIAGTYTASPSSPITVNGAASLSGALTAGTNAVTIGGDVLLDGTLSSDGVVAFSGNQLQTIQFNGALTSPSLLNTIIFNGSVSPVLNSLEAPTFTNVIINNTAGITSSEPWTVVGNFTVNPGRNWNAGALDHTFKGGFNNAGSVTGSGKFTIAPGLPLVTTPTNIDLGTNFQNTGTVEFGGTLALTVSGAPTALNNLVLSNTNAAGLTSAGNMNVNGDMTINNGSIFNSGSGLTHTIKNNLLVNGVLNGNTSMFVLSPIDTTQIGGGGTLDFYDIRFDGIVSTTANFNVQRNLVNNGTFVPGDVSVNFTSSNAGTISGSAPVKSFTNISINKSASTLALGAGISGVKSLAINAGTFDLAAFTVTQNSGSGGSMTIAANASLVIGSTNTLPTFTLGYTVDPASTVEYNGTTQAITPFTYGHLVLSNAGTKTFSALSPTEVTNLANSATASLPNSATLRLNGNWLNNGTFTFGSTSLVTFKGIATQTVSGSSVTDFGNVSVTNTTTPGVSIESNQNLRGVLTLGSNAHVDADGSANTAVLRVMSSADSPTQDASIATLPSGASIAGSVTVQRYMTIEGPNSTRIYRYISSPVQNATVADMQNEIPVTGTFTGQSTCLGCVNSPSMYLYNETVTTGGIDGGYVAFPTATNTETFVPGRGYSMLVRGHLLTTALWDLRGPINSGAISLPVSFTSSGSITSDGWNLIGNPYPSTIDWNAASGWTKTNINATIYVRDNALASPQYATWNGVVGTNGGSRYIATGQGFWVKAGSASPVLSINENTKVAGTQTTFIRQGLPDNVLRITMAQGSVRDEAVIHFRADATNGFDDNADALKLLNSGFSLSTQLQGKDRLAINSLEGSFCATSVNVVFENAPVGAYTLTFDNLDTFIQPTTVILFDAFTGVTKDIQTNKIYSFNVTSDPKSSAGTRFSLSFSRQPAPMDFSVLPATACPGFGGSVELATTVEQVTYQLSVNGQFVFAQPGNGASLSFNVPASLLSEGENSVTVLAAPYNACGTPAEKTAKLMVEPVGVPQTADINICRQGSGTFNVTGAASGQQYRWYANADDVAPIASGASYTTASLTKSHTYFVSIAGAAGCEGERVAVAANVVYFEEPVIVVHSDSLLVDYPGTKQWYFNNQLLPGETRSSIKPQQTGTYSVVIPVGSCQAEASQSFIVAGDDPDDLAALSVFPNPASDYLYFQHKGSIVAEVRVKNVSGQDVGTVVLSTRRGETTGKFDMSAMASGLYFVEISYAEGTRRVKVLKK